MRDIRLERPAPRAVSALLPVLRHGQEIRTEPLSLLCWHAMLRGELELTCYSDSGVRCKIATADVDKILTGRGDAHVLVVCCTDSGFTFTLPKVQKRANLIRAGHSEAEVDRMLVDAVESLYPL